MPGSTLDPAHHAGNVSTLAGTCGKPGAADGPADQATFSRSLKSITCLANCSILIGDVANGRIRWALPTMLTDLSLKFHPYLCFLLYLDTKKIGACPDSSPQGVNAGSSAHTQGGAGARGGLPQGSGRAAAVLGGGRPAAGGQAGGPADCGGAGGAACRVALPPLAGHLPAQEGGAQAAALRRHEPGG